MICCASAGMAVRAELGIGAAPAQESESNRADKTHFRGFIKPPLTGYRYLDADPIVPAVSLLIVCEHTGPAENRSAITLHPGWARATLRPAPDLPASALP